MINIGIALGLMSLVIAIFKGLLGVTLWVSVPFGLVIGFVAFFFLGRRVQQKLEGLQMQMQKHIQEQKVEKAIEILKEGYAFKNHHIFIEAQLNSSIGQLYYIKKDYDNAFSYLKKGFFKNFMGNCMIAAIQYRNKDYDAMKETMDKVVSANKKEGFVYAIYAWFLYQLKDRDGAIKIISDGLKKLENNEKLLTNLSLLQNNKKMKMRIYGDIWVQFMLEKPPRMMQQQQPQHHGRISRKAQFRGR